MRLNYNIAAAFVLWLLLQAGGQAYAQNLITNSYFDGTANGWSFFAPGTELELSNPETVYGGTTAGNIVAEIDLLANLRQVNIAVTPGRPYALSFRHSRRTAASTANPSIISVKVYNGANTFLQQNVSSVNTTWAWTCAVFEFVPTTTTVSLDISNVTPGASTFGTLIDNVTMIPADLEVVSSGVHCAGGTLTLSAPVFPNNPDNLVPGYSWTGPNLFTATTPAITFTNLQPALNGVYTYTATLNYCLELSGSDTISVNAPEASFVPGSVAAPQNDTGCAPYALSFENTSLHANHYSWDFGDGSPLSFIESPSHIYPDAGSYLVTLIAYDSCQASDTAQLQIVVVHIPTPVVTVSDTLVCRQGAITLQAHTAGTGNYYYRWAPVAGITGPANQSSVVVNPAVATVYTVRVTDSLPGLCGASVTDTIRIEYVPAALSIATPDTTVCSGFVIPVAASGSPLYTYQWTPAAGVSNPSILQPQITAGQSTVYILNGSYPGCPDTSVSLSIAVEQVPMIELGSDKYVCPGTLVPLEASVSPFRNDYTYEWSPAGGLSAPAAANAWFRADTTGRYRLRVSTPAGCEATDSLLVTVYPRKEIGISPDTGYCSGGKVQLQANGGLQYSWWPSYGLSDTSVADPLASPGTSVQYRVAIADQYGCTDTAQVFVDVYPSAVVNFPDTILLYPGESFHLQPATNCTYFSWFPPSGMDNTLIADPSFSPEVRTRYFVTATTEHGCMVHDSLDVVLRCPVMNVPNAFAPSGSLRYFSPVAAAGSTMKRFCVFNRWGNMVYSASEDPRGWDGTWKGKAQPAGVYVYIVEGLSACGEPFVRNGNVTLIR